MIKVAAALGWLNPSEERAELVRAIADQIAFDTVTVADVDLACSLNRDGSLDIEQWRALLPKSTLQRPANAGVLACLGSNDARVRVLEALTSADVEDVHVEDADAEIEALFGSGGANDECSRANVGITTNIAHIKLVVPTTLSPEEEEHLRAYAGAGGQRVNPERSGFFKRKKKK